MKEELQKQADKNDLIIVSYNKNYYNLNAILKDKNEDRYIQITINDLSCFKDRSYSCVALRIIKNPKQIGGVANRSCTWNEIGKMSRKLIEWKKREEAKEFQDMELEK